MSGTLGHYGKTLLVPFDVEGVEVTYKAYCANCGHDHFVMSQDRKYIGCAKCLHSSFAYEGTQEDDWSFGWNLTP